MAIFVKKTLLFVSYLVTFVFSLSVIVMLSSSRNIFLLFSLLIFVGCTAVPNQKAEIKQANASKKQKSNLAKTQTADKQIYQIKPSNLVVIKSVQSAQELGAIKLGFITSKRCISTSHQLSWIEKKVLFDLKKKAFDLGANALVVDYCHKTIQSDCAQMYRCEAIAFSASIVKQL